MRNEVHHPRFSGVLPDVDSAKCAFEMRAAGVQVEVSTAQSNREYYSLACTRVLHSVNSQKRRGNDEYSDHSDLDGGVI